MMHLPAQEPPGSPANHQQHGERPRADPPSRPGGEQPCRHLRLRHDASRREQGCVSAASAPGVRSPVAANSQSAQPPSLVFNRSRLLPEVDSETSSLVALGPSTPKAEFTVRSRRFGSVGSRFTSSPAGLSFLCLNSRFKINSRSTEAAFALPL